jgi:hypothetical protein
MWQRDAGQSDKARKKELDRFDPGWRHKTYPNGAKMYAKDGTMLDDKGNRSIFDDVDE